MRLAIPNRDGFEGCCGTDRSRFATARLGALGGTLLALLPALASNCHSSADTSHRLQEIQTMAEALTPYVDGFVWMPALTGRSGDWDRQDFRSAAQLMSAAAPGRLLLVEMPTFEQPDELAWLDLVGAFVDGGGMLSLP